MNILEAIILGIIQGITEWLPVSSSGHLVIVQQIANIQADLLFDIILHFASLLVILITFRKQVIKIITFKSKLTMPLIIGTIPIALAGYFLHDFIQSLFSSLLTVAIALTITGILLYTTKYSLPIKKINNKKSLLIGIAQSCALVPGISRSGATISTSLLLGIKRKQAAAFSFLLAVPAIIGALILELTKTELTINLPIIIGFLTTFIVGYLTLKILLKIIQKNKFHLFSYYCIPIGIILLILTLL